MTSFIVVNKSFETAICDWWGTQFSGGMTFRDPFFLYIGHWSQWLYKAIIIEPDDFQCSYFVKSWYRFPIMVESHLQATVIQIIDLMESADPADQREQRGA